LKKIEDKQQFRTIEGILEFAVKREEEEAAFYKGMMATARTPGLEILLGELMGEEENHKKLLLELSAGKIEDLKPIKVADLKISDYLIAEPTHPDMGFQDLLIFAARKEHKAARLYAALAQRSTKKRVRKLFEFLAGQEKIHKLRLESEYERLFLAED
jgi:rubrerythrin